MTPRGETGNDFGVRPTAEGSATNLALAGVGANDDAILWTQVGYELSEAKAEIERHHRDFARISALVAELLVFPPSSREAAVAALREIRNIVG